MMFLPDLEELGLVGAELTKEDVRPLKVHFTKLKAVSLVEEGEYWTFNQDEAK